MCVTAYELIFSTYRVRAENSLRIDTGDTVYWG